MDIPAAKINNYFAPAPLCGGSHWAAIHEKLAAFPLWPLASPACLQELGLQRLALLLLQRGEVLVEAPSHSDQFGPGPEDHTSGLSDLELQQQQGWSGGSGNNVVAGEGLRGQAACIGQFHWHAQL